MRTALIALAILVSGTAAGLFLYSRNLDAECAQQTRVWFADFSEERDSPQTTVTLSASKYQWLQNRCLAYTIADTYYQEDRKSQVSHQITDVFHNKVIAVSLPPSYRAEIDPTYPASLEIREFLELQKNLFK